jgi:hypothetical protein
LAASTPGSILWRDDRRTRVVLEGTGAVFPTELVDFRDLRVGDAGAVWTLELDLSDLDAAALGCVRLYLNAAHPDVDALRRGDDDPRTAAIRSVLRWDVARQLITTALQNDEFVERDAYPPDSVGEALAFTVRSHFPTEDPRSLRALLQRDPTRFTARLQAACGLLGEHR